MLVEDVSRHAADRYCERVMELDIRGLTDEQFEGIAKKIIGELSKHHPDHEVIASGVFGIDDYKVVKEDGRVVTVKLKTRKALNYIRSVNPQPRRQPKEF